MLDLGFSVELRRIHNAAKHRRRQTLMFSATLDNAEVHDLAMELLNEPKRISIDSAQAQHTDIEQKFYLCDHLDHKEALLMRLLEEADYKQVMIFTATRSDTERLTEKLNEMKLKAVALSGSLNQNQRNTIMSQFERAVYKILVTTDIASRGIDISNVSHVINFDMPKHTEEYVHRVGRTGRAGNKGSAASLVVLKIGIASSELRISCTKTLSLMCLRDLKVSLKACVLRSRRLLNLVLSLELRNQTLARKWRRSLRNEIRLSIPMSLWVIQFSFRKRNQKQTQSNKTEPKGSVFYTLNLLPLPALGSGITV
ncbi:ATP-dependent RNA helicase [Vibrio ishigakensis]|uniref:ATP-dependent RNA helicase n=1 Tax=Vibrio ishigakensis TaxID=1481914 RepID=A0A0B8PF03_9VIBR|nr:ATP-dependent RNA helicase [Vibrio ishigakensis]